MSNETTSEARARLDQAARSPLVRPRDRWIHALGTAAMGPVFGLYGAFGSTTVATVAFFVVVGAVAWWHNRTPTVPRHARAIGNAAVTASLVLFALGLATINATDGPTWLRVVVAAVVALPGLVGGVLIARGPR